MIVTKLRRLDEDAPVDRLRRLVASLQRAIEHALPWFDPTQEAAKDRRVAARIRRADEVSVRVRIGSEVIRDRMAARQR